jgi:hypothetical protein
MLEAGIIHKTLQSLNSLDKVREFIALLGFSFKDEKISLRDFKHALRDEIDNDSLRIIGDASGLPVVFFKLEEHKNGNIDRHLIKVERELIRKLDVVSHDATACIVVGASPDFKRVHFINAKRIGSRLVLRRFLIGADQNMRTAAERLTYLKLKNETDWDTILSKVDEAFDREEVTENFFKAFESVFFDIKNEIIKGQNVTEHDAHQFLHTLLNRLMFLYYIQRKEWLADGNIEFVRTIWTRYKEGNFPKDAFYKVWLSQLFFEAFAKPFTPRRAFEQAGVPRDIAEAFEKAPYLNGGLFRVKEGIDDLGIYITDEMFDRIFRDLLNAYNFTVTEDTPFDQNIAVDPEMLGVVYESLVNTTDFSDEKKGSGIFYTPRVEVDFMCRRTLVEYLSNHTNADRIDLYQFIFPEEGEQVVPNFHKKIRDSISDTLLNVTVVDPACGSGAFLVGMMQVILELRQELALQNKETIDEFTEKKRIIERSLYGVDVKEWAINVAQLRLWLSLIEVADEKKLDLPGMKVAKEALLPSLSFKLRSGDSLVQEIVGITLPVRAVKGALSDKIQRKVTQLRELKKDFYFNRGDIKERDLKRKEIALYESLLDEKIAGIDAEIKRVQNAEKAAFQDDLLAVMQSKEERENRFRKDMVDQEEKRKADIQHLVEEKQKLFEMRRSLKDKKQLFWSIEFAEIFSDKGGFDIVVGNPPYVRQEKIADPILLEHDKNPTPDEKKLYKSKLERMVRDDWSDFYGKIDKKNDLYIYFYLKGLALLNPKGTFCYITSNSWLDVGYGKGLQEFLLKHGRVIGIYDNEVKRSFKNADVNTIIALLAPVANGKKKQSISAEHLARFVMFKQPFESAITSDALLTIEDAESRTVINGSHGGKPVARVVAMNQVELYKAGVLDDDDVVKKIESGNFTGVYTGNKWGGKYLRAPDIYWTILEKGKGKLVRLGDIAEVRFGIKTGANEFFYLDADKIAEWGIEEEFLKPVIKSPRECKSILINPDDLKYKIFMCHKDKKELKGTRALKYIEWGEKQKFHERPSCRGRNRWWDLGDRRFAPLICPSSVSELFRVFRNSNVFADKRLYEIYPSVDKNLMHVALNSTLSTLFLELGSRTGLGEGLLDMAVYEVADCPIVIDIDPDNTMSSIKNLENIEQLPLDEEILNPSRIEIDRLIFDAIGLNKAEQLSVYKAVKQLVKERYSKAVSTE